jgi:hypothetical protein
VKVRPNCLRLEIQLASCAFSLDRDNAGSNIEARIAMIAITTNNSISVNADSRRREEPTAAEA